MPSKYKRFNDLCAELLEAEGEESDEYVKNVVTGLGSVNKKDLSEAEVMAVNVTNLLIALIGNIITKAKPTRKIESATRVNAYKIDELEQYGRRENVRISGIKEEDGENLKAKMVDLARAMNVDLEERDINVVHRLGKPGSPLRSIIVRFVSRDTRYKLLTQKKNLKGYDSYKNVFINEDLTALRQKLFYKLRKSELVESCYN